MIKIKNFSYIKNIIYHYSKLLGSFILEKTTKNVLYGINEFISLYGKPSNVRCDNGKEFKNKLLNNYCENHRIK